MWTFTLQKNSLPSCTQVSNQGIIQERKLLQSQTKELYRKGNCCSLKPRNYTGKETLAKNLGKQRHCRSYREIPENHWFLFWVICYGNIRKRVHFANHTIAYITRLVNVYGQDLRLDGFVYVPLQKYSTYLFVLSDNWWLCMFMCIIYTTVHIYKNTRPIGLF